MDHSEPSQADAAHTRRHAGIHLHRRTGIAMAGIFITAIVLVMMLQEVPPQQSWIFVLFGLSVLLPYGIWLAVVLHYDPSTPRPESLMVTALAWGSLFAFIVAVVFEEAFAVIDASWGVPGLDTMIVAPFWEEITKGLFIILLYGLGRRHLRGPCDGLVYGALVGTGFGVTEDIGYLNGSLSGDGLTDLISTYLLREICTTHAHPMFTAATGLAAGIAARRGLPLGKALWWILSGFSIAFALHAIFDSTTVFAPLAVFPLALAYAVVFVIALRRLHRHEIVKAARQETTATG